MENRYTGILREHDAEILALHPAVPFLWHLMAQLMKRHAPAHSWILELGCGTGGPAKVVLEETQLNLHLVDISQEMLDEAQNNLKAFELRTDYIKADASTFLSGKIRYKTIYSSWAIHNFEWPDKMVLFHRIFNNLYRGGHFLLMDKVYPQGDWRKPLEMQLKRNREFLDPKVEEELCIHEKEDASSPYRMDEIQTIQALGSIGFGVKLIDRVERDALIMCTKL